MSGDQQKTDKAAERRARLAAAQAVISERLETLTEREADEEVAKAELEAKNTKVIAELELKHGPVDVEWRAVFTPEGVIAVKRAHPAFYKRFSEIEKPKTSDLEQLVNPALIHPERDRFDYLVEKFPHSLVQCANAICWLAGVRKELEAKK